MANVVASGSEQWKGRIGSRERRREEENEKSMHFAKEIGN